MVTFGVSSQFVRFALLAGAVAVAGQLCAAASFADSAHPVVVDIKPSHILNVFTPVRALGAGIDSQNLGAVEAIYTPANVNAMLSAGLGPVSYRLYTELSVQHWHWNPVGSWSSKNEGYWTGASTTNNFIRDTFGYRLPHRGFTNDQGNNDDYSRLTDGDPATYWKSDPYLSSEFTGEPDSMHPQWAVVDLGSPVGIDAARISWTHPYAVSYRVQYWTGADAINDPAHGSWATFPRGAITDGEGGTVTLRLSTPPISMEFLRIEMTRSSRTCDSHGDDDLRNCVGYAIGEIGIGTIDSRGAFHDLVTHVANNSQTITYVSSVDPWHSPANRVKDQEQAGLDIVYRSGLTRGMPAMVAVGMLYGTPQDAAAEIRYLELHRYPISYVELGEEPDGQFILPEDYGALYLQWARAVHAVDPTLRLGGPVFQGGTSDVQAWPNASGDVSWLHRFLQYLRRHGRLNDLSFMSFEHYPFDPCDPSYFDDLYAEPAVLQGIVATYRADGLPPHIPMFITELNFSAGAARAFQDIVGGLWLADFEGSFLAAGGNGTFLYQYEPEPLVTSSSNCTSYGAWGMFAADNNNQIRQRTSQFFAAQLITQQWAQPVDAAHAMYPSASNIIDMRGNQLVTSYALLRPDETWALMLINKDRTEPHAVTVSFRDGAHRDHYFSGAVFEASFGRPQYAWHANGSNGFANPDGPPVASTQAGGKGSIYTLAPASITILRGSVR
ncbi:MAG TPA: discoidin domain-containing protein [Candidatus Eremiobacteraceae bacterium]|nr:discoidin domain-containing protein [Candidatus Eremiobacteraceae bacterium]